MVLIQPTERFVDSYLHALRRGWTSDAVADTPAETRIARIEADRRAFVEGIDDVEGRQPPVRLPDGSVVPRLPSIDRWMWDGGFAGRIGLRWNPLGPELPPLVLGHIGYSVVPWRRGRGYATSALAQMLTEARDRAMPYVDITADEANAASRRVAEANRAVLLETFALPTVFGGGSAVRYRIDLT